MTKTQDVTLSSLDLTKFFRELRDTHKWDTTVIGGNAWVNIFTSNVNHLNEVKAMAFLMGLVEYEVTSSPYEWSLGFKKPK